MAWADGLRRPRNAPSPARELPTCSSWVAFCQFQQVHLGVVVRVRGCRARPCDSGDAATRRPDADRGDSSCGGARRVGDPYNARRASATSTDHPVSLAWRTRGHGAPGCGAPATLPAVCVPLCRAPGPDRSGSGQDQATTCITPSPRLGPVRRRGPGPPCTARPSPGYGPAWPRL